MKQCLYITVQKEELTSGSIFTAKVLSNNTSDNHRTTRDCSSETQSHGEKFRNKKFQNKRKKKQEGN